MYHKSVVKVKEYNDKNENDKDKEIANFLSDENLHRIIIKENNNKVNKDNYLFSFCFIMLLFFFFTLNLRFINIKKTPMQIIEIPQPRQLNNNIFSNILPKINLSDNNIPELNEIFRSRIIYINELNVSSDYIHYIRPIDEREEEEYKKELYPDILPDMNFSEIRPHQLSIKTFLEICNREKLLDSEKLVASDNPLISIIVPSYNKKDELMKSVRSIQNQSFKNIELIIIDDCSTDGTKDLYEILLKTDPRVRIFYHLKNMGVFRTRIDGFLYSRGKYVLHFDPGDLYADNLVLEDMYNLITKFHLDSVRFSFKMIEVKENGKDMVFRKEYPLKFLKISYGPVYHNVHVLGYGTIWDRITRANVFTKGLCLLDEVILNCYKNMWEDMWWNQLSNYVSLSHLIVNRIGYMYYSSAKGEGNVKIITDKLRHRTIKEFILFWLFDLELLSKEDNKKDIIRKLRHYNTPENTFHGTNMHLGFLIEKFRIYEILLNRLINDPYVDEKDKKFVSTLLEEYNNKFKDEK